MLSTSDQDKIADPFVVRAWFAAPSADGNVHIVVPEVREEPALLNPT